MRSLRDTLIVCYRNDRSKRKSYVCRRLTSNPSRGPSAAYAAGLERLGTACRTFHLRGTAAFAFIMLMIGNHNTFIMSMIGNHNIILFGVGVIDAAQQRQSKVYLKRTSTLFWSFRGWTVCALATVVISASRIAVDASLLMEASPT